MAIVLGLIAGIGLLLMVLGMIPRPVRAQPIVVSARTPRPGDASGKGKGGDAGPKKLQVEDVANIAASRIQRDVLSSKSMIVQDALMVGRPLETHALHKMIGLVMGAAFLAMCSLFASTLLGLNLPLIVTLAAAAAGGLGGWFIPDSILRTEADKERVLFQQVTESWLELVAQLVTAGQDTFAALITAASYSKQPGFVIIREALRVAAVSGEPPWTALRRMADDRRLRFLDPFCSALELAGTTGAGSRQAILAQVDAARSKAMLEADAVAASASEKMGAPLALIGGGFMVLMGYPPLAGILDTSNLSGL